MICLVLVSWAYRLLFLTFYLAQAFKMLTKKYALHYCSAFVEVRSGGTIGAYAITWSRLIAIDEFHSPKKSTDFCPQWLAISFGSICFVSFCFVSFRFDLFRFVSICFVSFRFVSFDYIFWKKNCGFKFDQIQGLFPKFSFLGNYLFSTVKTGVLSYILIWLDSFPLLSQRTRTVHY